MIFATYSTPTKSAPAASASRALSPAAVLLRQEAKVEKGSGTPNKTKVGSVTEAQVRKIAELKMPDLNCDTIESAMQMIRGAARSMGLEVKG